MDISTSRLNRTIEEVTATAQRTYGELANALQRFASDPASFSALHTLKLALDQACMYLSSAGNDREIYQQLEFIVLAGSMESMTFLWAFESDIHTICEYVRKANPSGGSVSRADVDIYSQTLHRYAGVLQSSLNRSMQYVNLYLELTILVTKTPQSVSALKVNWYY
jgi:hypothetical protein